MQHLDEGLIHAWLDNALPADEAARVAAHAAECSDCAAAIAEARGLVAGASRIVSALDVARGGVVPARSTNATRSLWHRLSLTPSRAAIAATILLAVGSVLTLRHRPASDGPPVGKVIDSRLIEPQVARSGPAPRVADSTRTAKPTAAPAAGHVEAMRDSALIESRAEARRETTPSRGAAATPAAKAADAAVDSAKTSQAAANVAQNEQKSMAAGLAGARARSAERRMEAVPAAPNAVMGGFAPTRLESAVLTAPDGFCFAIRPLQGDTSTWLRALPERFALGNAGETSGDRAGDVRVPSSTGRVDSVLQGGSWQQTGPGRITVVFDAQRAIELHVAASPITADARSAAETHPIAVGRSNCPR